MRFGGFVLLAVSACGDVKDPNKLADAPLQQDGAIDSPTIDAPDVDAPPPRCDPSKAFGTPVPVTELNSASDDVVPYLTPDELTITFGSTRPGGAGSTDAYIATRTSTTAAFGPVTPVMGVNTTTPENRPMIMADGLRIYFETNLTRTGRTPSRPVQPRRATSARGP